MRDAHFEERELMLGAGVHPRVLMTKVSKQRGRVRAMGIDRLHRAVVGITGVLLAFACGAQAQAGAGLDARQLISALLAHENEAAEHRGHYRYVSEERSDRTGGHLWSERVEETNWGKVRYLVAVDGRPLEAEQLAAEKARVAEEAEHPDAFKQKEAARVDDEQHAKQMLTLLEKAFLFEAPRPEGEFLRVEFQPNPEYTPQSMEERVLHAMNGAVLVDAKLIRLREIEGNIPRDVSIGFGLLATIHRGSNFSTVREHLEDVDWKTQTLHTDIRGKALFLKTIARQQESKHTEFKKIANGMSVADAVALLER